MLPCCILATVLTGMTAVAPEFDFSTLPPKGAVGPAYSFIIRLRLANGILDDSSFLDYGNAIDDQKGSRDMIYRGYQLSNWTIRRSGTSFTVTGWVDPAGRHHPVLKAWVIGNGPVPALRWVPRPYIDYAPYDAVLNTAEIDFSDWPMADYRLVLKVWADKKLLGTAEVRVGSKATAAQGPFRRRPKPGESMTWDPVFVTPAEVRDEVRRQLRATAVWAEALGSDNLVVGGAGKRMLTKITLDTSDRAGGRPEPPKPWGIGGMSNLMDDVIVNGRSIKK